MKPKSFYLKAYPISQAAKQLGYKSTKTLYRLLSRNILEDYIYVEKSGRVYLMIEPPNKIPLAKKILKNIQIRRYNAIRNSGYLKKKKI